MQLQESVERKNKTTYTKHLLQNFRSKWQKFVIYNNGFSLRIAEFNIVVMRLFFLYCQWKKAFSPADIKLINRKIFVHKSKEIDEKAEDTQSPTDSMPCFLTLTFFSSVVRWDE